MGSIVWKRTNADFRKSKSLKAETELIYDGKHDLVETNYENGLLYSESFL